MSFSPLYSVHIVGIEQGETWGRGQAPPMLLFVYRLISLYKADIIDRSRRNTAKPQRQTPSRARPYTSPTQTPTPLPDPRGADLHTANTTLLPEATANPTLKCPCRHPIGSETNRSARPARPSSRPPRAQVVSVRLILRDSTRKPVHCTIRAGIVIRMCSRRLGGGRGWGVA